MRSHLLTAIVVFTCSSFFNEKDLCHLNSRHRYAATKNIFDFAIHRLSNERVFISWHTANEPGQVIYEVLRRHTKREVFVSLGVVPPNSREDSTADYSFTDINSFPDSSYYCLKKTNADSVIFYSITKGIEGTAEER